MTVEFKDILAKRFTESGGRLVVRSALNPALWLCAIVSMPALLAASFSNNPPWWIGVIISGPILIAIFGFVYLLIYDRDKLQSEDYQIRKKTLELIEQKGMSSPIPSSALAQIVTPALVDALDEREQEK